MGDKPDNPNSGSVVLFPSHPLSDFTIETTTEDAWDPVPVRGGGGGSESKGQRFYVTPT